MVLYLSCNNMMTKLFVNITTLLQFLQITIHVMIFSYLSIIAQFRWKTNLFHNCVMLLYCSKILFIVCSIKKINLPLFLTQNLTRVAT